MRVLMSLIFYFCASVQLQPMADGSAASGAGEEHHHHGAGDGPSFRIEDLPAVTSLPAPA